MFYDLIYSWHFQVMLILKGKTVFMVYKIIINVIIGYKTLCSNQIGFVQKSGSGRNMEWANLFEQVKEVLWVQVTDLPK